MSRQALLRYRADRLLRKDFAGMRKKVVTAVAGRLRARGVRLDAADLDACYAQAWHALYAKTLVGEQIEDSAAWLVLATYRRAIDEHRARRRQQAALEAQLALGSWQHAGATDTDVAVALDDGAKLRRLLEGLKASLSPREQRAAVLCYVHGLPRAQAARELGVSEKRMRKLMDGSREKPGVAAKVDAVLQKIGADEWCEQQDSLVRAYALGLLDRDGERYALAKAHVRECPRCRRLVLVVRGLATILPPLPLRIQPGLRGQAASKARAGAARAGRLQPKLPVLSLRFAASAVMALGVAGGYALLGKGSPVGPARSAASSYRPLPVHAAPARAAPAQRSAHAAAGHALRARAPIRHRRKAAHHRHLAAAAAPIAALAEPRSPAPQRARAPLGEFTPERTR